MADTRIIYGFHSVMTRLRQSPESIREIYLDAGRHDHRMRDLIRLAGDRNVRVHAIEDPQRLSGMVPGARHQGVVARVDIARTQVNLDDVIDSLEEPALLMVLDGVQDPHNLGACLRVADAFGIHAVLAPKDRSVGITPVVSKVACGAAETMPYIMVTNLARTLRELKESGIWVVGAHGEAEIDLHSMKLNGPVAWVLGAEGEGLRRLTRETCDELVRIPMVGSVESLNVSVAAGICMYETRRQRAMQGGKQD